jgi:hypothetical protein
MVTLENTGLSDLAGTVSHYFWRIVLEAAQIWQEPQQKNRHNHTTVPAQIWRELAPHYFSADCFGGSSDMAVTTTKKLTTTISPQNQIN